MATRVVDVNEVLEGYVGLDLECFDLIYLNGWVPTLQVPGQVVGFLTRHLGFPIPSPAILERIVLGFRKAVAEFAADGGIPVIRFAKGQRKLEVMRPHLDRLIGQGRTGVAAIGVAQEFQRVFTGKKHTIRWSEKRGADQGPLNHMRRIQTLPTQDRALLPIRRILILHDNRQLVLRTKRATRWTRRRSLRRPRSRRRWRLDSSATASRTATLLR